MLVGNLATGKPSKRECQDIQHPLQQSVLAYNLGNLWRRPALPKRIDLWSLTSVRQWLVKTGGHVERPTRDPWLLVAEGHLTRPCRRLRDSSGYGGQDIVETQARGRGGVCGAEGKGGSSGFGRHGRGRTSSRRSDRGTREGKMLPE
jgi:hypothetical protein